MIDIKKLAAYMSSKEIFSWVNDAPNDVEKRQRIEQAKKNFLAQSNFANFSAVEDVGNESGIYDDCADFAEYSAKARQVSAFERIKSIVSVSNIRENAKQWALQKNEIVRRNKAKKAERDAQKKDKFVSHPSWF